MQPDEWCLRHFDHLSDDLAQDLPETMARLRERCPVTRSDAHGGFWVVSGHEEALKVAQDWETYSSAHGLAITDLPSGMARNLPVQADPPEALIFKRLVTPYFSPAAVRDANLAGHPVKRGDKVLIHWAAANRDAREFPDPDRFDPARERNRHLTFGAGPHRCIGSHLARMNMRIALEELLRRLDNINLAPDAPIRYHAGLTRSPLTVPITFTPRIAAAS